MPWPIAAFPLILLLLSAWITGGLALARVALRLRGGVEVAALALPLGVLAQVLAANALGYVVFLPAAMLLSLAVALVGGLVALRRGAPAPLEWELGRRARAALLLLAVALGLGVWDLGSREVFGDDGGHASMAHLLASGEFPLRFQCNPALRASYPYGGDLLAAQVMVATGAPPWEALDLVRAASVTGVLALAFLVGWRPRRSTPAGLLASFLLLTVGPMLWIYLPFSRAGLAHWADATPALAPLVDATATLVHNPWKYGVVTPGFITPTYGHAHRALAWGFAPFQALLFLALLEAPLTRRRKSLALGLVLGATTLMQAGILVVLLPGFAAYVALAWWRGRRGGPRPRLDFDVLTVLGVALALALLQGGPVTDSLRDRLDGVANPTTGFHFDPPRLPSCRNRDPSLACALLSVANLGLTPFLLPWAALRLRGPEDRRRLLPVAGCAVAYLFPFLFRYDYIDWNVQRVLTYASWTLVVVLAPLLAERLGAGGPRRLLAAAAVLLISYQGLVAVGVIVEASTVLDRADRAFFHIGPLDEQMARHGPRLPRGAVVLDPVRCLSGTACRPAILFGRYAAYSRDRLNYHEPSDGYIEALADPRPETLRRLGYTHFYVDGAWLAGPGARGGLAGSAFALVGSAADAKDLRLLLRVCAPEERCALSVPGIE